MASIIATSIDLTKIPKDKVINGKKGKYLPITITLNDELDNFGNNGPVTVQQSKEERESKSDKVYLGNVKVVWTNGNNVDAAPRDAGDAMMSSPPQRAQSPIDDDLPF